MPSKYIRKTDRGPSRPYAKPGEGLEWIRSVVASPPEGCAEFPGAVAVTGYGQTYVDGKVVSAHRVAFTMAHGPIPDGAFVLHGKEAPCVSRRCCNPNHLRVGTLQDNAADRMRDGTTVRGSAHHLAKATEGQVVDIRARHAAGAGLAALCTLTGLSKSAVHAIVTRRTWTHVP